MSQPLPLSVFLTLTTKKKHNQKTHSFQRTRLHNRILSCTEKQTIGSFIHGSLSSHVELRSDDVLALDALVQGVIQNGHEPLAWKEMGMVVVRLLPQSKTDIVNDVGRRHFHVADHLVFQRFVTLLPVSTTCLQKPPMSPDCYCNAL